MKKIYSLLFAMLLAFVGAGSAWARTYGNGDIVNDYDLNDGDIVCYGATIVINWEDFYGIKILDSEGNEADYICDNYTIGEGTKYNNFFNAETQFVVYKNYDDFEIVLTAKEQDNNNEIATITFKLYDITSNAYYASFHSDEAWEVPTGDKGHDTEVLVITEIDGNELSTTTIARSGDIVTGGVPVLLKSASERTVKINKSSETPTVNYTGDNLLVGSDDEQTFDNSNYVYYILSKSNGVTGFYWQSGSNKGDKVVNGAHKASLQVPRSVAPSNALNIRFDDTVTAINSAKTQSISDTYYNMQGKRVNANSNGILIRNGHKYIAR